MFARLFRRPDAEAFPGLTEDEIRAVKLLRKAGENWPASLNLAPPMGHSGFGVWKRTGEGMSQHIVDIPTIRNGSRGE